MAERSSLTALVIRTAGTNCDAELCRAFEAAGAQPRLEHVDTLARTPSVLDCAQLIGIPGGFSHGDDIAAGRVLAATLRRRLWPALAEAARRGTPMIGICNGFQVMVQCGLLPGPEPGHDWPDTAPEPTLALVANKAGRYIDRWCRVEAALDSPCVWTTPLSRLGEHDPARVLPVAHGEGRLIADASLLDALEQRGQLALHYHPDDSPSGSVRGIAGVCDTTGRIFGLMPHPERYLTWRHHPAPSTLATHDERTPGQAMFDAAVNLVREDAAV
jgi:phosphoribosylformylglycinamidine synthase subunit PurQ / glutaminase